MVRKCICCKYRLKHKSTSVSLFGFPKDKELVNKWLSVLGMEGRVLHGSSCICSRHFKEKDFRYSLVGGNRFLKRGAIPSLFLDGEYRNDRSSDSQEEDASAEENRSTNIADEHIAAEITGGVALDAIATKSRLEQARKSDYRSSSDIKRKSDALKESKACDDVRFASRRCRSESRAPESELPEPSPPDRSVELENKCKKQLYDVRWEEISTSPVQAKIYWEVAMGKITRQKRILKTLRQKVKRMKGKISELQDLVKNLGDDS